MSMYVLNELLSNGLELVYAAHHQGAAQVDANTSSSTSPELKALLEAGAKENRDQVVRLEKVFKILGLTPQGTPDRTMQGILDTNNTLVAQTTNPTERDLINISAGQHAVHYYLATYGALRHYAHELGRTKVAKLLQKTLDENGAVNKRLTSLSTEIIRHSNRRTATKSESGGVTASIIPAFLIVGAVGTAITLATQSLTASTAD